MNNLLGCLFFCTFAPRYIDYRNRRYGNGDYAIEDIMNFYDRKQEIAQLLEIEELSYEVSQFTVVSGRRRIGKTELVKKAYEDKNMLYFFVARKAEADLCDTFILQNQSPKALSQDIEALSQSMKDTELAYQRGKEDIFEKAVTNSVLMRNTTGYYSIEKASLNASSNIRIDPLDACLNAFIANYIDNSRGVVNGSDAIDEWDELF